MDLTTYSLNNNYSEYTPLSCLYRIPLEHGKKIFEGSWDQRVVHFLITFTECLPIIGQIAALFEMIIMQRYHEARKPQDPTPADLGITDQEAAAQRALLREIEERNRGGNLPARQGPYQGVGRIVADVQADIDARAAADPLVDILDQARAGDGAASGILAGEDPQVQRAILGVIQLQRGIADPPPPLQRAILVQPPQALGLDFLETAELSAEEAAALRRSDERLVAQIKSTPLRRDVGFHPIIDERGEIQDKEGVPFQIPGNIYLGIPGLMAACESRLGNAPFPIRSSARLIAISLINNPQKFKIQYGEDSVIHLSAEGLPPLLSAADGIIHPDLQRYFNMIDRYRSQGHAIFFDLRGGPQLTKQLAQRYLCYKLRQADSGLPYQAAVQLLLQKCCWS